MGSLRLVPAWIARCCRLAACIVLLSLIMSGLVGAVEPDRKDIEGMPDGEALRVGVYLSPPFTMKDAEGEYSGMAIELWEAAAEKLGWKYDYFDRDTFGELVDAVADGELDVAMTNLSITRQRAERLDFTHPWYDAGMRVLVLDQAGGSGGMWLALRQSGHLRAYAFLVCLMLLVTLALTLFDRRYDKEFPKEWHDGLAESFYQVMSITTSGKTKRRNMFGSAGKIAAALWMACGVALVAYVTSSVTSVMTTMSLTRHINGLEDLPGRTVGVLAGSTAEQYARSVRLDLVPYQDVDSAVQGLRDGSIMAVVADAPVLEYYAHSHPGSGVAVVGSTFNKDKYGFGLPHGSSQTKPLTVQLIGMHESGDLELLREKYFGPVRGR